MRHHLHILQVPLPQATIVTYTCHQVFIPWLDQIALNLIIVCYVRCEQCFLSSDIELDNLSILKFNQVYIVSHSFQILYRMS